MVRVGDPDSDSDSNAFPLELIFLGSLVELSAVSVGTDISGVAS